MQSPILSPGALLVAKDDAVVGGVGTPPAAKEWIDSGLKPELLSSLEKSQWQNPFWTDPKARGLDQGKIFFVSVDRSSSSM